MKVKCGKCNAILNIKTNDKTSGSIKFKCPICSIVNKVSLESPQTISNKVDDKTKISNSNFLQDAMGWLVIHDENTKQQTYTLKKGKNIVGRKSTSKPCDIQVETEDSYMSRNHLAIEINLGTKGLEYLVYDVTSTNGTYINANKQQKLNTMDKVFLKDGDTIQAGHTKMVLCTKKMAGTAKNATNTVISTKPLKTIIVQ